MSPQTTGRGLKPDEAFIGLVDYGLFADKIPPCFTSQGLSAHVPPKLQKILTEKDERKLKKLLEKRDHDYTRYSALRDTMVPRAMGIPHPESHLIQSLAIKRYWTKIKRSCAKPRVPLSRLFVRKIRGRSEIFRMNYKGAERMELEETEIAFQTGATFKVTADISTCFPSIYTHSIPWAMHSKRKAKTNHSLTLAGNLLDTATRIAKDAQTNGLIIGPHASNILAEIILTQVDVALLDNNHDRTYRHIDDYTFYAKSFDEAETFIRDLGLALREYQLSLNEKKTRITPVPCPQNDGWLRDLRGFQFSRDLQGIVHFNDVRHFLDLALDVAAKLSKFSVLNYAIQMVPVTLDARAKRLFTKETVNLALAYPYLAPMMEEFVFTKHINPDTASARENFANELLNIGIVKIHPDSIAYALYYALKYNFDLQLAEDELGKIVDIDDCICDVLLLEYSKRRRLAKLRRKIVTRANNLKQQDRREGDAFWLLIYQVWTENDLRGNQQGFLADLKHAGFSFLAI